MADCQRDACWLSSSCTDPGSCDADPGSCDADPGSCDADPGSRDADAPETPLEVVVVRSCNTCPWLRGHSYCGLMGRRDINAPIAGGGGAPPRYCPLRAADVLVKLEVPR